MLFHRFAFRPQQQKTMDVDMDVVDVTAIESKAAAELDDALEIDVASETPSFPPLSAAAMSVSDIDSINLVLILVEGGEGWAS